MDFFQKFPREKVVTHLKSFLGVILNIWHGWNACDKEKIQHLLEAQCGLQWIIRQNAECQIRLLKIKTI